MGFEEIKITPGGDPEQKKTDQLAQEGIEKRGVIPAGDMDSINQPDPEQVEKAEQGLKEVLEGVKKMEDNGVIVDIEK